MMVPRIIEDLMRRAESAEGLDRVARPVAGFVAKAVPQGAVSDLIHGTWLGHPLHPMLTDLPIGCWTSAFFLDLLGGASARPAADRLVGLGVLTALPTAAAGLADWADTMGAERRVGLVHAAANLAATGLYLASYGARRRGHRGGGVVLSLLGATAATVGGYLGGHLSYRQGVNVNRNAWDPGPSDWVPVVDEDDLVEGRPVAARAGDTDVVLVRQASRVRALADTCSHLGGPLHEGKVEDGCIVCPWHGSTFRLSDGSIVRGPATSPQPAYDTRIADGKVAVRLRR